MRLFFATVCLAALGVTTPIVAQELIYSSNAVTSCLARNADTNYQETCIGASASQCMTDTPGGDSTAGMVGCFDREWMWWDGQLNAHYKVAMRISKQMDVDNAGFGASQADALRAMQRAWIKFRDAKCDYERSQWGGGTGGGPATVSCLMSETATQALYLKQIGAEGY